MRGTDEKKNWLMRYCYAKRRQNERADELRELLHVAATSGHPDALPTHRKGDYQGLERYATRLESYQKAEEAAEAAAWRIRAEVEAAIATVHDPAQELVLTYRYLVHKATAYEKAHGLLPTEVLTWQDIASRCGISYDRATHIHGDALQQIVIPDMSSNCSLTT